MGQLASRLAEIAAAAGTPVGEPIDRAHLQRMTLGDRGLAREVLKLFDRQSEILTARIPDADAAGVRALAHTIKGSARGVGAWRVAQAAEALENSADTISERDAAVDQLVFAIDEARVQIGNLLNAH